MSISSNEFAAAVGLRTPFRIAFGRRGRNRRSRPTVVELNQPYALIGRSAECDVRLTDPSVSQFHVYVQALEGGLYAVDLNSRGGLSADGEKWSQVWLYEGQVLQVGAFDVRAAGGEPPPIERSLPTEAETDADPALALAVVGNAGEPIHCPLRHPLTLIGRGGECNLRLIDPRVRSLHAAVVRTPIAPWLVNLRAVGGVRLNGELVRAARLSAGDRIGLNGFTLEVRPNRVVEPRPVAEPGEPPITLAPLPLPVGEGHQHTLLVANVYAALQEQMRLMRQQNEILEDIRDAVRAGRVPVAPAAAGSDPAVPRQLPLSPPPPQVAKASAPEAVPALTDAHDWLMSRLGMLGKGG